MKMNVINDYAKANGLAMCLLKADTEESICWRNEATIAVRFCTKTTKHKYKRC